MVDTDSSNGFFNGRNVLAVGIATFSIIILGVIAWKGIAALETAGGEVAARNAALQNLYSTFLPLIGTWMGAVIAFYFGKENFDAANKSVQAMVQKVLTSEDKLKSIKVSDPNVMITVDNIFYNKDINTKLDSAILVQTDLLGFFETNKNIERLPIMDSLMVVRYILHKSLITDFAWNFSQKKFTDATMAAKSFNQVTLSDLINNSDDVYKLSVTKSAEFVAKDATLLEAQNKINNSKYCQDVFVTATGLPGTPVIGWITNNKVIELSKV